MKLRNLKTRNKENKKKYCKQINYELNFFEHHILFGVLTPIKFIPDLTT